MRGKLVVIAALALTLGMAGCGDDGEGDSAMTKRVELAIHDEFTEGPADGISVGKIGCVHRDGGEYKCIADIWDSGERQTVVIDASCDDKRCAFDVKD